MDSSRSAIRERFFRQGLLLASALFLFTLPAQAGELRALVEAEAGVRSDGNYRQAAVTEDEVLDEELEQEVARAGLRLLLSYVTAEKFELALGYSPAYERTLGDAEVSGTTHRLDLGFRGDLTRRLSLQVRERLLSAPNLDLYAPATAGEATAVTRRGDQLRHGLTVSLNHELSRRTSLLAGLSHSLQTFEESNLFDAETLGANLGAGFRFAEDRQLGVSAGLALYTWEDDREADVQTLGVSYSHPLGRSSGFAVEAGSFNIDATRPARAPLPGEEPEEPEEESTTGWRGGLQFHQQRELFQWNAGYRHDVSAGYGLGTPSEVDNVFLGISTNVGRRLTLGLDGNASRHEDILDLRRGADVEEDDEAGGPRELEFAAGTARFSWNIFQFLRLNGGYSRVWQRSDVEPFDNLSYDRYFLGLAIRIFSTGETPRSPDELERRGAPTDDDEEPEPDAQ
ncbi:MAG TPA: hypothetical protein VF756_05120 [Thermoanaerobaculia bacterium]